MPNNREDIIFEKPSVWPGILIAYDSDTEEFSVRSSDTLCGYLVPRGDLVGDYRNFGEVVNQIMSGCDIPVMLLLDASAATEINRIWEMNIILF